MGSEFISFGILNLSKFICHAVCTVVHRVAVGWCLGDSFCDCMYYPKADYFEEVKSINSIYWEVAENEKSIFWEVKECMKKKLRILVILIAVIGRYSRLLFHAKEIR